MLDNKKDSAAGKYLFYSSCCCCHQKVVPKTKPQINLPGRSALFQEETTRKSALLPGKSALLPGGCSKNKKFPGRSAQSLVVNKKLKRKYVVNRVHTQPNWDK